MTKLISYLCQLFLLRHSIINCHRSKYLESKKKEHRQSKNRNRRNKPTTTMVSNGLQSVIWTFICISNVERVPTLRADTLDCKNQQCDPKTWTNLLHSMQCMDTATPAPGPYTEYCIMQKINDNNEDPQGTGDDAGVVEINCGPVCNSHFISTLLLVIERLFCE